MNETYKTRVNKLDNKINHLLQLSLLLRSLNVDTYLSQQIIHSKVLSGVGTLFVWKFLRGCGGVRSLPQLLSRFHKVQKIAP